NITYPLDEYGVALSNLKMGLMPPASGFYNNWFYRGMGASIRSEIWACISPGYPEIAGYYAWLDASVDHHGDGVYGEIFLACMESMAFRESDIRSLIDNALGFIPSDTDVVKVGRCCLSLFDMGCTLREARDEVLNLFGHTNFTDCIQNIGFILLGLLYGDGSFRRTVQLAICCGYDSDCTGGTAGAVMGIILGRNRLEQEMPIEVDGRLVVDERIKGIRYPYDLAELAVQTEKIADCLSKEDGLPRIIRPFVLPEIAQFVPPLEISFLVSRPFTLDKTGHLIRNEGMQWSKAIFSQNYLDLKGYFSDELPEIIYLATRIRLPEEGEYILYPASSDGVKLWVDGDLVFSHHTHGEFMPAFHRPGSPLVRMTLASNWHDILIEVTRCKEVLEFAWLVADKNQHLVSDVEYEMNLSALRPAFEAQSRIGICN
ncbi:MAG: ADP-ribosylglycohydrolase family protein, partial [bacterium]|nr:ADP-ribosylglycohydrolase family protein [bacterium]